MCTHLEGYLHHEKMHRGGLWVALLNLVRPVYQTIWSDIYDYNTASTPICSPTLHETPHR